MEEKEEGKEMEDIIIGPPMVNLKARSPVWGFQYGLERACDVDEHVTHEIKPAGELMDKQTAQTDGQIKTIFMHQCTHTHTVLLTWKVLRPPGPNWQSALLLQPGRRLG